MTLHFTRDLYREEERIILPCLEGIEHADDILLALPNRWADEP
jgi:hypothetical protein